MLFTSSFKSAVSNKIWRKYLSSESASQSPLEGIRILDLSRVLAGPFATMILGDLGAEIIKIERPKTGDDTRSWGPPFLEGTKKDCNSRESTYFLSINRNKKSVCVDMSKAEGQNIIKSLAKESDVLVENFVPGALERKGLGFSELKIINPKLIYCSITGFGPDGPYSKRGGYDVIAASMGGLTHVTGEKEGGPMKVGVAMTDLATSLYAHGAILAALYQRDRTGRGQKIDCNLLSTQVSSMVNLASNYLNAGIIPERWGTGHASIVPYQTFPTLDGHITIGCGNNNQFKDLCIKLDMADLPADPRFRNNEDRVQNRDTLVNIISCKLKEKNNNDWCNRFEGSSFPYGPVNNMEQVFSDPQVQHNKMKQNIDHSSLGEISQVGPAVRYSEANNQIRTPPPTLGEHTDSVLKDILGLSPQQIQQYRQQGVIA